ncbi:MAG: ABC-F family ATP-binding cassette domain-containing protein [Thomasclavelia sp.]|nr:ABC-F family ATP-binding cassette domain-containing protein [Thomasclavelia sp.]
MLIECSNLEKSYNGIPILKNVTFKINDKDKISIVGVNGAGKTTLLKIILKEEEFDGGNLFENRDLTVGCLYQQPDLDLHTTVYDSVLDVFKEVINIESRMRELELEMSSNHSNEIMNEYDKLSNKFNNLNGYSYPSRINGVLKGLGFKEEEYNHKVDDLSGGQKTRLALARLLLEEPKLLILDEPTNHLDSDALDFLENYLKNYPNALLIVSHDRYFINQTTNTIVEIENGKSTVYNCNYEEYSSRKLVNRNIELKHYISQQKEIKKMQESIDTLKSFNREKSVKRARSKEKQLSKIERVERPESLPSSITMNFNPRVESGFDVLKVDDLTVGYEKDVISNINLDIKQGERVAIVGENGVGKTTLFRALLGSIPTRKGKIKFGAKVETAYYDQEHQNINFNKNIFKEIGDTYPKMTNTEIRNTLAMFDFKGEDVFKEINDLSGGEKGRVSLCKILLKQANLLILDEPTNHLDISSKEVLEEALISFKGTILFISHDRYFIDKVATRIIEITPSKAISYDSYSSYKENRFIKETTKESSNEEYSDYKKQNSIDRKTKNKINKIEKQISELEEKIKALEVKQRSDEAMNDFVLYNDISKEIEEDNKQLEILLESWENIQ